MNKTVRLGRPREVMAMSERPENPPVGSNPPSTAEPAPQTTACPACGGRLVEIRGKLQCSRCRTICETCCEGGRG
ncbi:MAG: hypothetical protein U0794_06250 [Isosphaeraceae bacterium]